MATLLLVVIYASFISLGLPDSLLGVAWPLMYPEYRAPIGFAGFITIIISGATILSSLISTKVLRRFGTDKVTFISVVLTAAALCGISRSPSQYWLLVLAVPLGLGAGAIDCGLNEYVAEHYKSRQMSWLHCFWGIGALTGPIIMSHFIGRQSSWRNGYFTVSMIQFTLAALLLFTLPLWKKAAENEADSTDTSTDGEESVQPLKRNGVVVSLLNFLFYCGVETTMGLWGSCFLVNGKGLNVATAAVWVSGFYGGITLGRFLSGFVTLKLSNQAIIRCGELIILAGVILMLLPLPGIACLFSYLMIGFGCAPIFPCMLHETPARFGKKNAQAIMGYQMAAAYCGSTFLPPIFGWTSSARAVWLFPFFILLYIIVLLCSSERMNRLLKQKQERIKDAA
ncbi:MAG TPA: MFS transporter [Caproiciproducens sp.]|nr:MFS transporter [Caproiciproducens sp.]